MPDGCRRRLMKTIYGIVQKEKGSSFGIRFPDLPGCFSAAESEEEIFAQAQNAIALYVRDEASLPKPRSMSDLRRDADVRADLISGAFLIAVPLVVNERKSRYNLMLDPSLVEGVDEVARAVGVSRSDFVARAVEQRLKLEKGAVVLGRTSSMRTSGGGKSEMQMAASALSQKKGLHSKTASKGTKAAAASVLTQKNR
jgi:predicted RNase H-like HicB family nuclease